MGNYNKKHKITLEITEHDLCLLDFVASYKRKDEFAHIRGMQLPKKHMGALILHEALVKYYRWYCNFRVLNKLFRKGKASLKLISRYNRFGLGYLKIREALERCRHAYGY